MNSPKFHMENEIALSVGRGKTIHCIKKTIDPEFRKPMISRIGFEPSGT
jgi:hypothetical protein